eukprot:364439-Chlamydomonas_euryale.AAC.3
MASACDIADVAVVCSSCHVLDDDAIIFGTTPHSYPIACVAIVAGELYPLVGACTCCSTCAAHHPQGMHVWWVCSAPRPGHAHVTCQLAQPANRACSIGR